MAAVDESGWDDGALSASLVPLCRVEAKVAPNIRLSGTPLGTRVIAELLSARFEGARFNAKLKGNAAADWLVISADGRIGLMDVRLTIETDDGALIYLQYNGRSLNSPESKRSEIRVSPRFETGDARYAWLNEALGVGKGFLDFSTGRLAYMFYLIR